MNETPMQEPVAWMNRETGKVTVCEPGHIYVFDVWAKSEIPLYAHPASEVEAARADLAKSKIRHANFVLDLCRVMDGERTINGFEEITRLEGMFEASARASLPAPNATEWTLLTDDEIDEIYERERPYNAFCYMARDLERAFIAKNVLRARHSADTDRLVSNEKESDTALLRQDAERYRWLRDEENGDSDLCPFVAGDSLDAAIDAARQALEKP